MGRHDGDGRLAAPIVGAGEGQFTVDLRGRITSWDAAMEDLTGYTASEAIGQGCRLLHGDACAGGPGGVDGASCAAVSAVGVRQRRCTIEHRLGHRLEILKDARPLRAADGTIVGAVEQVTDISLPAGPESDAARRLRHTTRGPGFAGMIGQGPAMQELFDLIELAARSRSSVIIEGETGTGKELVANAIHQRSPRASGPLVWVSCASLSEGLLESELFGHVRGAFTGAVSGRPGRFEAADGGTLVLDEIGDVSLAVQTKLLRVVQERQVERVGSNHSIPVDIRLVAATNRDLVAMCDAGTFRRDLYYRLAVIPVRVPPLRERREDIPLLVEHFVQKLNTAHGRVVRGLTPAAMERLILDPWPGNVRELEHAVECAFVVTRGTVIEEMALPVSVRSRRGPVRTSGASRRRGDPAQILAALEAEGGNREATARRLGVTRMTLWKWMRALGLTWPPAPHGPP